MAGADWGLVTAAASMLAAHFISGPVSIGVFQRPVCSFECLEMAYDSLMVFTGNAHPKLAEDVVKHLNIPLGRATVGRFSDGEVMVELLENVRGKDVFVLQSTCMPTNDNLMEVLLMADALKRSSAGRITAAVPYLGYARQDRRPRSARVAISAKVVANIMVGAGSRALLTIGFPAAPLPGFLVISVANVS